MRSAPLKNVVQVFLGSPGVFDTEAHTGYCLYKNPEE